jgi:hypothetical protein
MSRWSRSRQSTIEEVIGSIRASGSPAYHVFGFQQAFDVPKFGFDSSERTLASLDKPKSVLGSAADKLAVFHEHYQIIKTCLLHTHLFKALSL